MIPKNTLTADLELETIPSRTQHMQIVNKCIVGHCDNLEAMKQLIYKILNTERYEYIIYSWNYGIELKDLYGEPISYVCPELERRITEALTQDERILNVEAFIFDTSKKGQVNVSFTVSTIFGLVEAGKEVNV